MSLWTRRKCRLTWRAGRQRLQKYSVIFYLLLSLFALLIVLIQSWLSSQPLCLPSFSCPIGYTGATERVRLRSFRLQGTTYFGQSEKASLTFSFSQYCYYLRGYVHNYSDWHGRRCFKILCMRFSKRIFHPPAPPVARNFFPCFVLVMLSRAFHQLHFPALSTTDVSFALSVSYISRAFN